MRSRQVQKVPWPAWVVARSARWKACECALAKPGRVRPLRRSAAPGAVGADGRTEVKRPPSASMRTSRRRPWPGSQARSASQRRTCGVGGGGRAGGGRAGRGGGGGGGRAGRGSGGRAGEILEHGGEGADA